MDTLIITNKYKLILYIYIKKKKITKLIIRKAISSVELVGAMWREMAILVKCMVWLL